MHTPSAFIEKDLLTLQQHMLATRLAILVTQGDQGLLASHVPLLLEPDQGPNGTLYGHLARANTQWHDLANGTEALVIFAGQDAYISPSFYPSKAEHGKAVLWITLLDVITGKSAFFVDNPGDKPVENPVDKLVDNFFIGSAFSGSFAT